ncbi:ERF family protein [Microbacterium sp. kSW2-24]|uniref:ERF family protein n=1 Tax=Microbacterium galbinum TaxID=2851646 RepID=UPI001FFC4354|nr:ERF family protein [Microbacterium galbinum]MCK2024605.1 ERF family protein [Microbacterium galbinum]
MTTEEKTTPHASLAAALSAFQYELPRIQKGSRNDHFKSNYADLADVVGVVLPALARQGLAWITVPTLTSAGFVLEYSLKHVGGESIDGSWPLPDPSAATPQAVGSAVTYAKRYALSAVTGVAPDEDDDGNQASKAEPEGWKRLIDDSKSIEELTAVYQRADAEGWKTPQVLASLNARRAVLNAAARENGEAPRD